jgi:chromosome segregation ATPase
MAKAKPITPREQLEALATCERELRRVKADLRPDRHVPTQLTQATAIVEEREQEVAGCLKDLGRIKASIETLAPRLDQAQTVVSTRDAELKTIERSVALHEDGLERADAELAQMAQDPDCDLARASQVILARLTHAELLRLGYQHRDKLRSERVKAASTVGDLENEFAGHRREVEKIGAKLEKAQSGLETARRSISEWTTAIETLRIRERELETRICKFHEAGIALPAA